MLYSFTYLVFCISLHMLFYRLSKQALPIQTKTVIGLGISTSISVPTILDIYIHSLHIGLPTQGHSMQFEQWQKVQHPAQMFNEHNDIVALYSTKWSSSTWLHLVELILIIYYVFFYVTKSSTGQTCQELFEMHDTFCTDAAVQTCSRGTFVGNTT